MTRYTHLLFDLDHTLLDSDSSERQALLATLAEFAVDDPVQHLDVYRKINLNLWAQVEAGLVRPDDIRAERFRQLSAQLGLDVDPTAMGNLYVEALGNSGELYPGALNLLKRLRPDHTLGLVSNGIGEVQRARVRRLGLDQYFEAVVISGEVGVAKPNVEIFEIVMNDLGKPSKASVMMIGDSLTSDIAGGLAFGIDTCWYNPRNKSSDGIAPTYTVSSLFEIVQFLA